MDPIAITMIFLYTFQFINGYSSEDIEQLCADCRLTSDSIDDLLRKPRQMDTYGSMADRIDVDKIKKNICKEISKDSQRERCRNFYYTHAINLMDAWKRSNSRISFFDFACIKELKYCCPRNSYGPKCVKCQDCNFNEQCHGDGTRTGNGTCQCKDGHTGPSCSSCLPGFYSDSVYNQQSNYSNKTQKIICKACHKSCLYCRHQGPLGCEVCAKGFAWIPAHGCSDVDECIKSDNKICGPNTFCVNTEGSYFCYGKYTSIRRISRLIWSYSNRIWFFIECDRACDGCYGDGPDMCLRCTQGYKLDNGYCVALKKTIIPPEANYYRYAIYVGLSICTCIILHNNVYIASVIGLGVALYIGFCEYIMATHTNEMNIKWDRHNQSILNQSCKRVKTVWSQKNLE